MPEYTAPLKDSAALITLSAQRDYTLPKSPIRASGLKRALPALSLLVHGCRDKSLPIYHSIRLYRPDGSNVDVCRRRDVENGLRVFMPGSMGAELIPEALPEDDTHRIEAEHLMAGEFQTIGNREKIFYRPRWGAFHGTNLEEELKAQGITTLILCGFSFTTATRATVYEASARDFRVVVVPDALCNASDAALSELGRMGVYLMESEQVVSWLD
ncbi:cysteine hydrolase family protein [Kiloniella sp. b19]|uniref:cysteine hydrolase family protein n=1 Tax=Kiloniella sp. GXU_MW_B19 TaxID=3141326 RepID=UPI0031D701BC